MLLIQILIVGFLFVTERVVDAFSICDAKNFMQIAKEQNETFYVFALTQDCQLIFARADQLSQFHGLATDIHQHITYCLPNLVQFHWQNKKPNGNLSLKLVFKRANNQVCILPVDFPRESALLGETVFRYSLLNSLTYAVCSYMPNSTFLIEPELSFMDSLYVDVIYFVDPKSAGSFWTIRQFKIDKSGYLKALETFVVKNFAEEPDFVSRTAGEHLLSLDTQKLKLYSAHKLHKDVSSTCSYDLLFRPHKAKIQRHLPMRNSISTYRLNSFSVDKNTTLFVESQRNHNNNGFQSRVFVSDRRVNYSAKCLLELPYAVKFELISSQTLAKMREKQLPTFDSKFVAKHHHKTTPHHHQHSWTPKHPPQIRPTTTTTHQPKTTTSPEEEFLTPPPQHEQPDQLPQGDTEEEEQPSRLPSEEDDDIVDESLIEDENEIQTTLIPIHSVESFHDEQQLTEEGMGNAENGRLQNDTHSSFHPTNHLPVIFVLLPSLSLSLLHRVLV